MLDRSNPLQAKIIDRLEREEFAFLITVRPDGRPHAIPVCFLYENDSILVFSKPNSVKVYNIRQNSHVCLALDSFGFEDYLSVVVEGKAELVNEPSNWLEYPPYDSKYMPLSKRLFGQDHSPKEFVEQFSQAIRITSLKVRQDQ